MCYNQSIMELWFIYAVASALFAGLFTFLQKIAVERGYSPALMNSYSNAISSILALAVILLFFGFGGAWKLGLLLGFFVGLTHTIGAIFRMDALKYIDTAIFFPIYKTIAPVFILLVGMLAFGEDFTTLEWIGIALGITVPLLLLHKKENSRQKNLKKGILLLLFATLFSVARSGMSKYGVDIFETVFLFMAVFQGFSAILGFGIYKLQKNGIKYIGEVTKHEVMNKQILIISFISGVAEFFASATFLLALKGGLLGVVFTINSLYIVIPIILSIIIYKEHWNAFKVVAIVLSIVALAFLK